MFEAKNIKYATDRELKDKYEGEKCLIIGGAYRDETKGREYQRCHTLDKWRHFVMGCNSAYKVRRVDFLCWIDINFSTLYKDDLKRLECMKFVAYPTKWECLDFEYYGVRCGDPNIISRSFDNGMYPHNQSGFFALNIAIALGFSEIYLTGFCPNGKKEKKVAEMFNCLRPFTMIYTTDMRSMLADYFNYKPLTEVLKI